MSYLKNVWSKVATVIPARLQTRTGVLVFAALTAGLIIVPQASKLAQSVECANPPTVATLNPWPVAWYPSGELCHDFPAIAGRNVTRGKNFPTSQAQFQNGVNASAGEEVDVQMYVHNGAANNLAQSQTDAKNVQITTTVQSNTGTDHVISVTMRGTRADGSATNTVNSSFVVHTAANEKLEVVPNSGKRYDSSNHLEQSGFQMGNNTVTISTLHACFDFSKFFIFTVRVVSPSITVTKEVRNASTNGLFVNETTISHTQIAEYHIRVKNTGNAVAQNVVVHDNIYNSSAVQVTASSINLGGGSGSLQNGVTFSSLAPNQEVIITYRVTPTGSATTCYIVNNTATAQATGLSQISDTAKLNISCTTYPTPAYTYPTPAYTYPTPAYTYPTPAYAYPTPAYTYPTPSYAYPTPAYTYPTPAYAYPTPAYAYPTPAYATPYGTPYATPYATPYHTPYATPYVTPYATPYHTPYATPYATPYGTPYSTPYATPYATPYHTPYATPYGTPYATPYGTPYATPYHTPYATPYGTPYATPYATPSVTIDKQVRLVNTGNFSKSVTTDSSSATVEYQIKVTSGNTTVNNVRLLENLPNGLTYVNGSARLDGAQISDGFINQSLSLGNYTANHTRTLIFRATANSGSQCDVTIANTASASGDNATTVTSSATVIIHRLCVAADRRLSINKLVRNITSNTTLQNTVQANNNDRVGYEVTVNNVGNDTINNVRVTDNLATGLTLDTNSVRVDGSSVSNQGGNNAINVNLGTMTQGQQKRVTFEVTINSANSSVIQNIAHATGDNANEVQDDAFVYINVGNSNVQLSKKAWNDTKNVDATSTPAAREDFITYTLMVSNTGTAAATNFVITDDLSGVLPLADMVDAGGGTVNGNIITYPSVTIPAGGSVTKTFKVRIKFHLNQNQTFTLSNTYGNTVTITVPGTPSTPFVSPKTGAGGMSAIAFGGLLTTGFVLWKKRSQIWNFIYV